MHDAILEATGVDGAGVAEAVDGCGMRTYALGLEGLASAFARLASGGLGPAGARVAAAMSEHPALVGFPGSIDTELMAAAPGVVAKIGAEAVIASGRPTAAASPSRSSTATAARSTPRRSSAPATSSGCRPTARRSARLAAPRDPQLARRGRRRARGDARLTAVRPVGRVEQRRRQRRARGARDADPDQAPVEVEVEDHAVQRGQAVGLLERVERDGLAHLRRLGPGEADVGLPGVVQRDEDLGHAREAISAAASTAAASSARSGSAATVRSSSSHGSATPVRTPASRSTIARPQYGDVRARVAALVAEHEPPVAQLGRGGEDRSVSTPKHSLVRFMRPSGSHMLASRPLSDEHEVGREAVERRAHDAVERVEVRGAARRPPAAGR